MPAATPSAPPRTASRAANTRRSSPTRVADERRLSAALPGTDAPPARRALRSLASSLALGATFAAGYASLGLSLADGAMMEKDDLVFQADVPRVITELTRTAGRHYRTKVHPTFVLLLNPPGRALRAVLGRPRLAAIVLTAAAGGIAVAAFRELLCLGGLGDMLATLWTLLFATSSAQVFFGSIPETFAFSAASLVVLFALHARGAPSLAASVAAGVLAFGMLITNLAAVGFLELSRPAAAWRSRIMRAGGVVTGVVLLAAALAAVQKVAYPDSLPFYVQGSLSEEPLYIRVPEDGSAALARLVDVAAHLTLFDLAAPEIAIDKPSAHFPVTTFAAPSFDHLRVAGRVHAALWLGLVGWAAIRAARSVGPRSPLMSVLGAWIGFNAALHLVYGDVLFLYAAQWTFAVVALVALALGTDRRLLAVLPPLLAAQVLANAAFLADLFRIYG